MMKFKLLASVKTLLLLVLLVCAPASALPSYTLEDDSQGLSDFAQFKDSLSGLVEFTDLKLGYADDIEVRVRHLTHAKSGKSVKGVCLLIPAGESSALLLVRYIDPDELDELLAALSDFENRMRSTRPEPDMRAYYMTRGRIGLGVKYYGKWKGIVTTDGITRTFGSRSYLRLTALLREAASQL